MKDKTTTQILDLIRRASSILLLGHTDPDGDSLGTQLVLSDFMSFLGKDSVIRSDGDIPGRYRFLPDIDKIKTPDDPLEIEPDVALVIDCTNLDRIGRCQRFIDERMKIVNIDHHIRNSRFGDLNLVRDTASSVGEVVYDFLAETDYKLTLQNAEQLYTAILTDTGRFHFSSTTPRALRICAELVEMGIDPREITDKIYFSMTPDQLRLRGKVMENAEVFLGGKICILTLTQQMLDDGHVDLADFEGLVEYSMQLSSVTIGVLFKEISPNEVKLSIRSRNGFDVAELARKFGGGGHINAAGAAIKLPVGEAKESFVRTAEQMLVADEN